MSEHVEIRYLTTSATAEILGVSVRTLERLRADGSGPPVTWIRLASGRASPRYRSDALHRWAVAHSPPESRGVGRGGDGDGDG